MLPGQSPQAPTPLRALPPTSRTTLTPFPTPSAPPHPPTGTPYVPGVNTYATAPSSDLRGQTIVPGQMADRNQLAQNYLTTWNQTTDPQYQADLRSATRQAAGAGQLGSGQLRTSLGNLAYNRDVQRQGQESNFLNNALSGSIEDAYRNIGIAQQQQQFQAGLQGQTFNQGLQSLLAGTSGNPADTLLGLSGIYNTNANTANQGLSSLISGTVGNSAQQQALQQILAQLGGAGAPTSAAPLPVGTPILRDPVPYGGVTG